MKKPLLQSLFLIFQVTSPAWSFHTMQSSSNPLGPLGTQMRSAILVPWPSVWGAKLIWLAQQPKFGWWIHCTSYTGYQHAFFRRKNIGHSCWYRWILILGRMGSRLLSRLIIILQFSTEFHHLPQTQLIRVDARPRRTNHNAFTMTERIK